MGYQETTLAVNLALSLAEAFMLHAADGVKCAAMLLLLQKAVMLSRVSGEIASSVLCPYSPFRGPGDI